MTTPRGVLAFTSGGYCIEKNNGKIKWRNIPQKLAAELKTAQQVYCIAVGPDDDFFCAWKGTDERPWMWNSLSNYPELSEAYNKGKDEWIQSRDFSKIHCSLAQNGSYYFNNNSGATAKVGQSHDGLDARLGKEINSKLVGGKFVQDPQLVALGIAQSYILLGNNGEILWDLKDHYTDLEKVLQESKVGVEVSRGDLA
ncbi:hypothetical protein LTS16_002046 [Friedmanniomyces endolithicus]|uniref:Uncharacterized protein n=1 Tax=Friedmanniomyces endolithicus TaxID=329885 RepID=A0AAN6FCL0_9PEZI|nr:hypothetical protein LTS09_007170 [Friedmanniomyces endolithicus]KAK0281770.1 hypothetical protein LTR35_007451 [Friedmanniomyces endolithicus]KAK0297237.1 hypothetical protein LTS00_003958 [Friedmanniomyces endolithicus]KAK0309551.1 hypothetical protein LTR82_015173 [Friedmanniomyces endolithicus]KAK0315623.1 hypothetical protein LTR01_000923 [Friedmanniomyces endolithicus]